MLISYEQAWETMERIKVECGAELPDGLDTLAATARAILDSADPPTGEDADFCYRARRNGTGLRTSNCHTAPRRGVSLVPGASRRR